MTRGMKDRDAELAIGVNVWMVQGTGELEVCSMISQYWCSRYPCEPSDLPGGE